MSTPAPPDWEDDKPEDLEDDDPGLDVEVLRRRRERVLTFLALILILGVSAFTAHRFLRARPTSPDEIRAAAQLAVREYLGVGLAIQFVPAEEFHMVARAEGLYEVSSNLVAVKPNGESQNYSFRCVLERGMDGGWRPTRLDLTPYY